MDINMNINEHMKSVEEVCIVCESVLKRELTPDEALIIGITFQMAFMDGMNKALEEVLKTF